MTESDKINPKRWAQVISAAVKEVRSWPEWMRREMRRVEGTDCD